MVVISLVVLFCIALILTLIGLCLPTRSRARTRRSVAYIPRAGRAVSQGNRTRNMRQDLVTDQPYRRLKQAYAPQERIGVTRRQARSVQAFPHELHSPTRWTGTRDIISMRSAYIPQWFKLTFITATIFSLCLFLFIQMLNSRLFPATIAIITNLAPQSQADSRNMTLSAADASKAIVRIAQSDPNQYGSQGEHDQWANSACSAAAMTEIINAYGHNYRITDILKVEAGLHEITPELGLLEAKGIDRTMGQFGFKMVPLEHVTLDSAISVANQGHPLIVSFANSGYWPGGHILVLRGGDAQNVDLADSSRLNKTVVSRDQFLQWWKGFTALAVPQ